MTIQDTMILTMILHVFLYLMFMIRNIEDAFDMALFIYFLVSLTITAYCLGGMNA